MSCRCGTIRSRGCYRWPGLRNQAPGLTYFQTVENTWCTFHLRALQASFGVAVTYTLVLSTLSERWNNHLPSYGSEL